MLGTGPAEQTRLAANRSLHPEEIALLELYQRQDALSTQLWQHFLLGNMAVVLVVVLITIAFRDSAPVLGYPLPWLLCIPVLGVWATFSYGGLSAIRNSQRVLLALAHQIEGDVGDKTDLFVVGPAKAREPA